MSVTQRGIAFPPVNALELVGVGKVIDGVSVLRGVDWSVGIDDHWVIIGPNGGGKSTLVQIAALQMHPTSGVVRVLGEELGRVDLRPLRSRIGLASAGLAGQLRGSLTAEEIVRCGRFAALEPWWHVYDDADRRRAVELLAEIGLADHVEQSFATLSSGERQRTLLARTLFNDPPVVMLDEPTAGLDFAGREALVGSLDQLAARPDAPATVLVTHHLEDIPSSSTHVMAITGGEVVAAGPIDDTLDEGLLEELYGMRVSLSRNGQRWSAAAASASASSSSRTFSTG